MCNNHRTMRLFRDELVFSPLIPLTRLVYLVVVCLLIRDIRSMIIGGFKGGDGDSRTDVRPFILGF